MGIFLILISIAVLYFNLSFFKGSFKKLWPSGILLFGVIFYIYYFSTKKKKNVAFSLFLATFFAVSSVPLFILTFTSLKNLSFLWPGFFLAFGVALLSLYYFEKKKRITSIISMILIFGSLLIWIFYSLRSQFGLIIGVSLLIIGAAFLTRGLIKEEKSDLTEPFQEGREVEHAETYIEPDDEN